MEQNPVSAQTCLIGLPEETKSLEGLDTDRAYVAYVDTLVFRMQAGLLWLGYTSCREVLPKLPAICDGKAEELDQNGTGEEKLVAPAVVVAEDGQSSGGAEPAGSDASGGKGDASDKTDAPAAAPLAACTEAGGAHTQEVAQAAHERVSTKYKDVAAPFDTNARKVPVSRPDLLLTNRAVDSRLAELLDMELKSDVDEFKAHFDSYVSQTKELAMSIVKGVAAIKQHLNLKKTKLTREVNKLK